MASARMWKLERTGGGPGQGPLTYRIAGFEKTDPNTMKVVKLMDELTQDDLKALQSELHDHFHGDEHG